MATGDTFRALVGSTLSRVRNRRVSVCVTTSNFNSINFNSTSPSLPHLVSSISHPRSTLKRPLNNVVKVHHILPICMRICFGTLGRVGTLKGVLWLQS
eukprot:scaffold6274_cov78-Skeletonema_marinoi.AAC.1